MADGRFEQDGQGPEQTNLYELGPEDAASVREDLATAEALRRAHSDPGDAYILGARTIRLIDDMNASFQQEEGIEAFVRPDVPPTAA